MPNCRSYDGGKVNITCYVAKRERSVETRQAACTGVRHGSRLFPSIGWLSFWGNCRHDGAALRRYLGQNGPQETSGTFQATNTIELSNFEAVSKARDP